MARKIRIIGVVLLLLLLGLAGLLVLLGKSPKVQTYVGQRIASYLSGEMGAEIRIDRVEFDFLRSAHLHHFLVMDQADDTLLYVPRVAASVRRLNIRRNRFAFGTLELDGADFRLRQIAEGGATNLDFITDYFGSADQTRKDAPSPVIWRADRVELKDCKFSFENPYSTENEIKNTVDLNSVFTSDIHGRFEQFRFKNDTISLRSEGFRFAEKSGLALNRLDGLVRIDPGGIAVDDMLLETPHSRLTGRLALLHTSWKDYSSFTSKVEWDAQFDNSRVHFKDIGYFVEALHGVEVPVHVSGQVQGPIGNLRGQELFLIAGERTILRGDLHMLGLPDWDNTFIDFRLNQLSSDYADLEELRISVEGAESQRGLPDELERAGALFFQGSFTGFPSDFVAFGNLTTEAGRLDLDLNVYSDTTSPTLYYAGSASAAAFEIGRILDIPELETVTATARIEAQSRQKIESARIEGTLASLTYRGYTYRNIQVDGEVESQRFSGTLDSDDPNMDLSFSGLIDFSLALPVYNFSANVRNLDLTTLQLVDLDKPLSFSTDIQMNGRGEAAIHFDGSLVAENSFICYGDSTILLENLVVSSLGDEEARKISLTSDMADLSITGKFQAGELLKGVEQLAALVMPSFREEVAFDFDADQYYDFSINYKQPNHLTGMLVKGLDIPAGTTVYGSFDNRNRTMEVLMRSSDLAYGTNRLKDLTLEAVVQDEVFAARINASALEIKDFRMEHPNVELKAFNDLATLEGRWFNGDRSSSGEVGLQATFFDLQSMAIELDTLALLARGSAWKLQRPARVDIDTSGVFVKDLFLANNQQEISLLGKIGKRPEDEAMLILKSIDLGYLDSLDIDLGYRLHGIANADVRASALLGSPVFTAQATIEGLEVNDAAVGDLALRTAYQRAENEIDLFAKLTKTGFEIAAFEGKYMVGAEAPLDGRILLDGFDLDAINAFNLGEVDQFSGLANGEISVKGGFNKPLLNGFIDFQNARFRVDYLNVFFEFSDRVRVDEDFFGIDYKPIADQSGRVGYVVASAFHENFSNWSYDISADVDNFMIMDTNRDMNDVFYGTAYATGFLQIGGFEDFLEISIDARTERGTSIRLPLDEPGEVTLENFVYFVGGDKDGIRRNKADLEGISMRLNIEATPDAEIQLIFDERAGDIMRGRGNGMITLEIAPTGEFQMFGRYEVVEGSYLFTLQNLVNKQFQVRPGGTVSWYGDPYEADLDIDAVYSLRTQLFPIMLENRERYRSREDVQVILTLQEKLLNPGISFDIELPQSTETERSQLESAISTTQMLNQQVFALLILNRFLPNVPDQEGQAAGGIGGLGSATTSDFVSTQISNWLSEISNEVEIGVNYRPGDQISNQEIAVALSTQLFNERVLVSGNFGVTQPTETQQTYGQGGLVGDFLLEYLITEDGKIRLKVFNETNPYEVFSTAGGMYTQGVGLVFMEDFDNLDDFFRKVGELFTNDKARKADS